MSNKLKSHKGARKRLKVTGSGKVRYKRSFAGHLMSGKSGDRKRRLRKYGYLHESIAQKIRGMMEG